MGRRLVSPKQEAEADAFVDKLIRARNTRLAVRDAEYARTLKKNPEGNNRNKGNAPIGRVSRKGSHSRKNHSGTHTSKPSY